VFNAPKLRVPPVTEQALATVAETARLAVAAIADPAMAMIAAAAVIARSFFIFSFLHLCCLI
jgi:hypothetical protein